MLPPHPLSGSDGLTSSASVTPTEIGGLHQPVPVHGARLDRSSPGIDSGSTSRRSSTEDLYSRETRGITSHVSGAANDEVRSIITQSFSPRVAVYASPDTEELIRLKGLYGGLCSLLRPFGEQVQGKVVVRDSSGASRSWNDFGIRFISFGQDHLSVSIKEPKEDDSRNLTAKNVRAYLNSGSLAIEKVVGCHIRHAIQDVHDHNDSRSNDDHVNSGFPQYFPLYLRKLLCDRPPVSYETFTHPVACVVAISSQNTSPIDTLRDLYNQTRQGSTSLPHWMSGDFLRYYILVHDEDHDDIAQSTSLFNQMKRHFGIHCHLLRLRSTPCGPENLDGAQLPMCQWLRAEEDALDLQQSGYDIDTSDFRQYLFDADAAVLRTFVREMVTQSIIPFMEGKVTSWNDQVASRRRGISGRFMSLSKRWTGFGAGRGPKSSTATTNAAGNYNVSSGAYDSDAPESIMHRLADYAFMLRDWKLSSSIHDILRTDFADDQAWRHYASASEMLAVGLLLSPHNTGSRFKADSIDQMVDAATYSYITRCADSQSAIRCLILVTELYRTRVPTHTERAASWAERLLELSLLSPLAQGLVVERLAQSYRFPSVSSAYYWGSRQRKEAMWNYISSTVWLGLNEPELAGARFEDAYTTYGHGVEKRSLPNFRGMGDCYEETKQRIAGDIRKSSIGTGALISNEHKANFDEAKETLGDTMTRGHHQQSISMGSKPHTDVVEILQKLKIPVETQNDGFTQS